VFARVLACSAQAIKVRLLDQAVLAGIGNIYASESLFQAGIAPDRPARSLQPQEVRALRRALRQVLRQAIRSGSSVPLDWLGTGPGDGFFYYGQSPGRGASRTERFRVYDRAGQPCLVCGSAIRRTVQSSRSTFSCPSCQPSRNAASPGRSPGTARLDRGLTA
jgi:formamidopyrimidine-DNA glycosylase